MIFNNPNNIELIHIIESTAKEKNVSKDDIFKALEDGLVAAAKIRYGNKNIIKISIDKKTGEIKLARAVTVVDKVNDYDTQVALDSGTNSSSLISPKIGDIILEPLPPIVMDRGIAQSVKHIIIDGIKNAEREREYSQFKDKVTEIFSGTIKKIDFNEVIVDISGVEAVLTKDEMIPGELFKINHNIKIYLKKVVRTNSGPQIILSRNDNGFLAKLMELEIPEIYDKQIEIRGIVRDPGSKSKVAVFARDNNIDPIGACVGVRGSRVKRIRNVSNELNGEKIDIILWNADPAQFVINALIPAQISKVILYENRKTVEVVVPEDQLSSTIGRQGQNVKLASRLVGVRIDVMTEDQESKRRAEDFNRITQLFIEGLNIEEIMAQLLAANNYSSIEQIATTPITTLSKMEGFDQELAQALQERALEYIENLQQRLIARLEELNFSQELLDYLDFDLNFLVGLAEAGITTLTDFRQLTLKTLLKILPNIDIEPQKLYSLIANADKVIEEE